MPYVPAADRPILNRKVDALAKDVVLELGNGDVELSGIYRNRFLDVCETISKLETRKILGDAGNQKATDLGAEIVDVAKKYGYKGAWLGEMNYSLTMLIQVVPFQMVKQGKWKEEFRYWLYAETVGALQRTALDVHKDLSFSGPDEWVTNGLVGVLVDVKDEYKRRVNPAYEAVQIKKSGDCYITPYFTQLEEVFDRKGNLIGWTEVEKDFRGIPVKEEKDKDGNVIGWKRV